MFLLRAPKRIFLRVPKPLPDPLIQGAAHLNAKNVFFWRLYIKKCTKKNMKNILGILHAHMSYTLVCSMVVQLLVVQYWLDTLMTLLGGGWVGWWLIQGMWVGAATTDTRVVVGGLVVLSDFVPRRFFLRVPERILRVPKQLPDPLIQGAAHLNAKNDFLKTLHQEMYQKKTWWIFL